MNNGMSRNISLVSMSFNEPEPIITLTNCIKKKITGGRTKYHRLIKALKIDLNSSIHHKNPVAINAPIGYNDQDLLNDIRKSAAERKTRLITFRYFLYGLSTLLFIWPESGLIILSK